MFRDTRRKKMRNRALFAVMGVLVLSFGIWLNYHASADEQAAEDTVKKVEVREDKSDDRETAAARNDDTAEQNNAEGTGTEPEPETYLIKEVDGVVKVFICDAEGNKELYLITSIPFDLLSESDQKLFEEGVTLQTEEDLGGFLQNFDS